MKSVLLVLIATASVGMASGQVKDGLKSSKPKPSGAVSTAPVTQAEAHATFVRLEKLLNKVLGSVHPAGASAIVSSAKPVNRLAVAREFERYRKATSTYFKLSFAAAPCETERILASSPADRQLLIALVKGGFVSDLGAIPCGPKDTLTVSQFGDAVGFFVSRVMEYCHMPSAKWTPELHKG
jgi:hypothetical protein